MLRHERHCYHVRRVSGSLSTCSVQTIGRWMAPSFPLSSQFTTNHPCSQSYRLRNRAHHVWPSRAVAVCFRHLWRPLRRVGRRVVHRPTRPPVDGQVPDGARAGGGRGACGIEQAGRQEHALQEGAGDSVPQGSEDVDPVHPVGGRAGAELGPDQRTSSLTLPSPAENH